MPYPHIYKDNSLVVQIFKIDKALSEIDIDKFIIDINDLNIHSKSEIMFDMGYKGYLNSSDLSTLIKIKDRLYDDNIDLILMNPSDNVAELLTIVGLKDFFKIAKE